MSLTKTEGSSKTQILTLINDFFAHFQTWCNKPNTPSPAELEHFLTKNFQLSINGKVTSKNLSDYQNRILTIKKNYSHLDIVGPLEEPLISNNQVAIHYEVDLSLPNGQKRHVFVIALATINDNKISKWVQVAHEKSTNTLKFLE